MHFIIHGSVIIYMWSKAVWWIMRAIQFNWLLKQFNHAYIEMKIVSPTFSCKMRCYKLETPWMYQRVYKTGVGANKKHRNERNSTIYK